MAMKRSRITPTLFCPVDIASLIVFRLLFGLLMCFSMVRFLAKGWVDSLYLQPTFFFTYLGFSWVHPWPAWGMYLHVVLLAVLALLIACGCWYRLSMTLFFVLFTYLELLDQTNYLNHYGCNSHIDEALSLRFCNAITL
jgi:vitamin K-dependent gamma-carboxylase